MATYGAIAAGKVPTGGQGQSGSVPQGSLSRTKDAASNASSAVLVKAQLSDAPDSKSMATGQHRNDQSRQANQNGHQNGHPAHGHPLGQVARAESGEKSQQQSWPSTQKASQKFQPIPSPWQQLQKQQQQQSTNHDNNQKQQAESENTSGAYSNSGGKNGDGTRVCDDGDNDEIDSALSAALRDQRERLGLLKLEKVMLNFMKSSDIYIEVGGLNNSIVISPTYGVITSSEQKRPQTAFQRCILHRLADRFSIRREKNLSNGFIRLIKQPGSKEPSRSLLDAEQQGPGSSEYMEHGGDHGNSNSNGANDIINPDIRLHETTKSMQGLSMNRAQNSAPGATSISTSSTGKRRSRKMKIMKRNSSGDSSRGSNHSASASGGNTRRNKNFADKEKAYAEARARIFSDSQNRDDGGSSNGPSNSAADGAASEKQAASSSAKPSLQRRSSGGDCDNIPNRVVGNTGKATYRNRQQEENDPDFQRGGSRLMPLHSYGNMSSAPAAASFQASPFAGGPPQAMPQYQQYHRQDVNNAQHFPSLNQATIVGQNSRPNANQLGREVHTNKVMFQPPHR